MEKKNFHIWFLSNSLMPQIRSVLQIVPKAHVAGSQHWFSQASILHIPKAFRSVCSDGKLSCHGNWEEQWDTTRAQIQLRFLAHLVWYWSDSPYVCQPPAPHLYLYTGISSHLTSVGLDKSWWDEDKNSSLEILFYSVFSLPVGFARWRQQWYCLAAGLRLPQSFSSARGCAGHLPVLWRNLIDWIVYLSHTVQIFVVP